MEKQMKKPYDNRQLLELSATALGLEGYWDTIPGVSPPQEAYYVSQSSMGTMSWAEEWNPLRDDHTRYRLLRTLGLLTRNRQLLDENIALLLEQGMPEDLAVDTAIVLSAAKLGSQSTQG